MNTPTTKQLKNTRVAFWGTSAFAVHTLNALAAYGITPELVVATPDKPAGRKKLLTPPPAKTWAGEHHLSTFQPASLKDKEVVDTLKEEGPWDLFIVASYGKIIPEEILHIPKHNTINIHPSLLPELRGPSPVRTAILEKANTGVSIMEMNAEMDAGPIIAQCEVPVDVWPPKTHALEETLAKEGVDLLVESVPAWMRGEEKATPQDHEKATFTKKFTKQDAELNWNDDPETNYRKIQAFDGNPRAFYFEEKEGKQIRVLVTDAECTNGELAITRVIPEGRKEMSYEDFKRGLD